MEVTAMTKITIFSGFLGAGKTTLIKKLIPTAYKGEKLVLIENEFGEIGIDGGFMKDAGIEVTEMNSGCICCSLVGDFGAALQKVLDEYHPDRILIEPSGVGKLSDVIRAVQALHADVELAGFVTVADASKCRIYMKNFGEFYNNQIEHASAIILSRTQNLPEDKLAAAVALLRGHNEKAPIVTTPWDALTGAQLLDAMEQKNSLMAELTALAGETAHTHHHHEDGCTCEACRHEHGHDEHRHDHGMSIATTKHTHTVETAVTAQKRITTAKTAPAGHAGTGTAITTPNTIITATRASPRGRGVHKLGNGIAPQIHRG